jgi:PAS domain S-box-containing protein
MKDEAKSNADSLRKKAEEKLSHISLETESPLTGIDSLRLIHELEVHQIELELQNEELKMAKEEAEAASQKYSELYDFSPSGYFTISNEGVIIELNLVGAKMLGKERQQLIKSNFGFFISDGSKPIFNQFLHDIFSSNTIESCEIILDVTDNLPRYFFLTGTITSIGAKCLVTMVDITTRRSAEEALKESLHYNPAIVLETAMDGFWLTDTQGRLLEVNEAYCRMSGYRSAELLSMRISDLEAIEGDEDIAKHREKLVLCGEDRFETKHRRKDGSIFDVEISIQYLKIKDGRFVSFLRDITERKRAEEELRNSERRYSALFGNKINGMAHCRIITDKQGKPVDYRILQVNEAYERIIGIKKADIEGRRVLEVFPDIQHYAIDYIGMYGKIALENGEIHFEEYFEATGQYLSIYAYSPIPGEFIAIFTDITNSKRSQEELAFQSKLLSEVNDAVFSSDRNFRITYWNQAAENMFGWTKEEVLGKNSGELLKPQVKSSSRDKERSKLRNTGCWKGEAQYLRKDGTYFFVEVNSKTLVDADDKYNGQLIVARDITERKRSEEALRESEALIRSVLNNVNSGVAMIDETGNFSLYNPLFLELFGLSAESTLKNVNDQNWAEWKVFNEKGNLLNVDDHPVRKAVLTGQRVDQQQVGVVLPSGGEMIWMLISAEPIFKENGDIEKIICTYHDITDLKLVEDALLKSEERFHLALKNSPVSVATQDRNLVFTWAYNQRTIDYKRIIGKTDTDLFAPEDLPVLMNAKRRVLELGTEERVNMWLTSNGQRVFLDIYIEPLKDATGDITGIGIATVNLTQQKLAESALYQYIKSQEALSVSTTQLLKSMPYAEFIRFVVQQIEQLAGNSLVIFNEFDTENERSYVRAASGTSKKITKLESIVNSPLIGLNFHIRNQFTKNLVNSGLMHASDGFYDFSFGQFSKELCRKIESELEIKSCYTMALSVEDDLIGNIVIGIESPNELPNKSLIETFIKQVSLILRNKRTEEALRKSERNLDAVINSVTETILMLDTKGKILTANETAARRWGMTQKELAGKNMFALVPHEMQEKRAEQIHEMIATGMPIHFQDQNNGDIYDLTFYPIKEQSGEINKFVVFNRDITIQKQAEEKLRQSREQYKSLFQGNHSVMLILDPKTGEIKDANPAASLYYGWSYSELCNKNISEFTVLTEEEVTFEIQKAKKEKRNQIYSKHQLATGEIRDVEIYSGSIIYNNSIMIYSIIHDITESKRISEELNRSKENLRAILDATKESIYVFDREGVIVEANETAAIRLKRNLREVVGHQFSEFIPEEMISRRWEFITRVFSSGEQLQFEDRRLNIQFEHNLFPIFSEGKVLYVVSYSRDITEQKRAQNALHESETRYRSLFEEGNDAIFLVDMATGRYIDCNRMAETLTGYSHEELTLMKTGALLPFAKKEDLDANWEIIRSGRVLRSETEIVKSDGSLIPVEFNSSMVTINEKQCILSMLHDISDRKAAEEALRQSEERVRLKLQSILLPEGSIAELELSDIIDAPLIQKLMENFYELSHIPMAIIDINGRTILSAGWQDICTKFHKAHPDTCQKCIESNVQLTRDIPEGEFKLYKCKNNMWELATPILIGGEHKGNLFMGQFFFDDEQIDYTQFRKQANEYDFAEQEYLEAINKAPRIKKQKLDHAKAFFLNLSQSISQLSYSNIKLARAIAQQKIIDDKLRESEEKFRNLVWDMQVGVLLYGPNLEVLMSNPKALELVGLTEDQLRHKTPFDPEWNAVNEDGTPFHLATHPVVQSLATGKAVRDMVIGVYHPVKRCRVWLLVHAKPQLNPDGTVLQVVCSFIDITSRKQAEEELRESEQRLKFHFENSPLANIEWNANFEVTQWSSEAEQIFGWKKEEIIGKQINSLNLIYEDDMPIVAHTMDVLFSGKEDSVVSSNRNLTKSGTIIECTWYNSVLVDQNGEMTSVMSLVQDITQRKKDEEALKKLNEELEDRVKERTVELSKLNASFREAEEKYRTVADYTYGWEYWLDQHDKMLYCSPSCERISGYKTSEFIENPQLLHDIIYPDDLMIYQSHKTREGLAQDSNQEIKYRIIRADGTVIWIGHVCQPIFDESGNFIGNRGSNRDITERIVIEQLLNTSNQKYKLISDNITDGVFILRDGNFEYVNNALNDILGYDDGQLEGVNLIQIVLPDYQKELRAFLALEAPANNTMNIEIECLRKDATTVFVEILLNYVANERVIYGVAHDITEKKQIQKNIVKAIIQTEEKERANFSKELHDGLGPILSTIKLYLQWSERPKSNKSREEIIHKAEDILEDALSAVKEISNKLSPHLLTNYGLTSAVQSFVDKLRETSAINITFDSNVTRRLGDEIEAAIYRAVIECINNTIKYAKAKNITITLNDTDDKLQLNYKDDGTGFNLPEILALKKGLGLFNLQNRIQSIGGKINLYSQPDKGVDYQIMVDL